jgi:DNA-binding Xre family transcriptional regulator
MPMKYDKLMAILEKRNISQYKIRIENIICQSAFQKLKNNTGIIDTRTFCRLCEYLDCQPGDIMEYVKEK